MKTKKIFSIVLLCSTIQACGNKKSSSSGLNTDKPIFTPQNPDNFPLNEQSPEDALQADLNPDNLQRAEQSFGTNIFESECSSNSNGFNNCSFNRISLNKYSIKMKNEYDFTVNYEFKNCDFDYLNATFYTLKNSHKIILGTNNAKLTGHSIYIQDPYVWDTKTNKYSPSCRFVINDIQASLSNYTVNSLNGYVRLMSEFKTILQMSLNLDTMFHTLNLLVDHIDSSNVSIQIKSIEEDLKQDLNKYDDHLWKAQVEKILFEIESFKNQEHFHRGADQAQIKNKITKIMKGLLLDINIEKISEKITSNKEKALEILDELSSYPNYDNQQYMKYKKIIEM